MSESIHELLRDLRCLKEQLESLPEEWNCDDCEFNMRYRLETEIREIRGKLAAAGK